MSVGVHPVNPFLQVGYFTVSSNSSEMKIYTLSDLLYSAEVMTLTSYIIMATLSHGLSPLFVFREMGNLFWQVGYFSISTNSSGMKVYTLTLQCTGDDPDKLHNYGYLISWVIFPFCI
jgi:hypothetical protein